MARFLNVVDIPEKNALLLLGLLGAYPQAIIYRIFFKESPSTIKNLYFSITGIWTLYFVFGNGMWHSLVDVIAVCAILKILKGSLISLILCWTITMGHLLCGYIYVMHSNQTHPITWTIPHCVLVLKLVGLTYNIYDGQRDQEQLSKEQKNLALYEIPGFIDVMGFSYFFGSLLVGPQIPFKRHQMFTRGELFSWRTTPSSVPAAMKRFLTGLFYAALYSTASQFFPVSFLVSEEYMKLNFPMRILYMIICGRVELWKLILVWLLAEGSCILSGISYQKEEGLHVQNDSNDSKATNGTHRPKQIQDEVVNWYALSNVHVLRCELSISLIDTIQCLNINTNHWIAMYVFKRLKFLGKKWQSRLLTLLFVSLWHGVWPGYYITFMFEFLGTLAEKRFVTYQEILFGYSLLKTHFPARGVFILAAFVLRNFFLMYPLVVFVLLDWNRCYLFMSSVYFFYPILLTGWMILYQILPKPRSKEKPL